MSREQIEEMAQIYDEARLKACETLGGMNEGEGMWYAKAFYEAGYRRQSEGEWVAADICAEDMYCSVCGGIAPVDCEKEEFYKSTFCPNCGARMK